MNLIQAIEKHCLNRVGRKPNYDNPRTFTDKMQWLKLNDQMPEHIVCVDKYLARAYIASILGNRYLLDVYGASSNIDTLDFLNFTFPFVLKANHDCGSVRVVNSLRDLSSAIRFLKIRGQRYYGFEKGEWAYSHVRPIFFAEECIPGDVIDFKFNCCGDEIKWVRIIRERSTGKPVEIVVDENYEPMNIFFDPKFLHSNVPPKKPSCWEEMKEISKKIGRKFRFVRVDLYDLKGAPKFGELTFWPLSGVLNSEFDLQFGELLSIDMSFKREPLNIDTDFSDLQRGLFKKHLHLLGLKLLRL